VGYALERFDWIGGGRWASTRHLRLFRRDPRIGYFASRAHASVGPSIHDHGGGVLLGDAPLHHLDALLDRDHAAKRAAMRARLAGQIAEGAPAILRCLHALERFAIDDDDGADRELSQALEQDARCEPIVSLFRAQQHLVRGRLDEAARDARHALSLENPRFRGRASAFVVVADVQARRGQREEAVLTMREALAEEPLASHHLNLAALGQGAQHVEEARRRNPWLGGEQTLRPPARPSIFQQQDALLACAAPLFAVNAPR
jgi:tetratricopeptide (TPR) repeat protein